MDTRITNTRHKLEYLMGECLYPSECIWTDIAAVVKAHPDKKQYTLKELESLLDVKGFQTRVAVMRLCIYPYNLFEATFIYTDKMGHEQTLTLAEYTRCYQNGGYKSFQGSFTSLEEINEKAEMYLKVLK